MTNNKQLYIDLDGVLADFVAGVQRILPSFVDGVSGDNSRKLDGQMWKAIRKYQQKGGQLWRELPLMSDAKALWDYVKHYNPQILTATGDPSFGAGSQKLEWVAQHFGPDVKVNITQKAKEKAQYAQSGFILIDDKLKAIDPWQQAGGTGVLHTSADTTIAHLKTLGL